LKWQQLQSNRGRWRIQDGALFIYLEGSVTYSDWVRNFMVGRRRTAQGYVNRVDHREALATIREMRQPLQVVKSVQVAGHSRGAAEAYAMAQELRAAGHCVRCVLFAPKRTGCREYQDSEYLAYRRRGDWVPFLPPWYAGWRCIVFGSWLPLWKAHEPREYQELIRGHGF
jgi:pimeloyl-ACP methyl ester carboxylesterase